MSAVRQIGIKMTVDAQSVTTELPRAGREFDNLGARAEQGAERATRSLARVNMSVRDIIQGAAGLHIVGSSISAIGDAISAMPREAFNYSKNLEVSQVGMAGILGSMTAINGQQTDYNKALQISSEYIRKLNDDALRTAASSQELTQVFQALLAPGLAAKMNMEEIRQLTVVGTNAVKSMGLDAGQVVQELRDLVAGGITPASSTLATALGLKDSDIAKAKASSEGLFKFLMDRLQGFQASSDAFNDTLKGKLDSVKEGAVRVAAEGMSPLIEATKTALDDISRLFVTFDSNKNVALNPELVNSIRSFSQGLADAAAMGRAGISVVWEHRSAVMALATAYGAVKIGTFISEMVTAVAAKREAAQASRLLAVQEAAEASGNAQVVASSRAKVAAYLAELEANAARARGEVVAQAAQIATLQTTQEAIVVARAEVVAKMNATRATMAQAEAQIAAARAAGAQSMALALVREGTQTLTAAQARHAALLAELATLGRQQAGVQASIAAATTASTAAQTAATAATGRLAAAQGAASLAGRTFGTVMGALGGPVGIAIAALTVLIGKLVEASWEASKVAKVGQSKERVDAALANGKQAEERDLARLRGQIENLKEQRDELLLDKKDGGLMGLLFGNDYQVGVDSKLRATNAQIDALSGSLGAAEKAAKAASTQTGELTLTVSGSEQAWRKANDGVKTASAIQSDYNDKLTASKASWEAYKKALEKDGVSSAKIGALQKEQEQNEKSLADERDKQIKALSAGAVSARSHGIDAEIAATKHGYKLLAAQTAESLAEIEALRKDGALGDSDALERRTALQLADIDAQRAALQAELALIKGKKESAKEQANLQGELAELAQKRISIEAAAERQQRELDAQAAEALEQRITGKQRDAQQAQESLRLAKLDTLEIGQTGAALGALRQARVEDTAAQLEAQARTMDGIDLSKRAGDALRAQAAAVREGAKVQGYNESARMVEDYARAVREASEATQFEQSLAAMSQRDREIALEQYRIAIQLKKQLEQIDAANPNDAAAAQRLKERASADAAKAQADAANRVFVRESAKSVDQINEIFRKGFADMVNGGEDTWKAFTKSLATSFKTTVADELYKAFAQPLVIPVIAAIQGVIGSIFGSAVGGGGGGSGLLGMASNAGSLYSLATGNSLWGTAASQIGGWLGLGGAAGTGLVAGAGSGLALAGTSAGLGLTGAAGTGFGLVGGGGLGLTATSAGAGTLGAGIGAGAGAGGMSSLFAAIPGWGWALGGIAALALGGAFGSRGANHSGAAYSTAGVGNDKAAERLFDRAGGDWYDDLTKRHNAALEKQLKGSLDGLSALYGNLGKWAKGGVRDVDLVGGFAVNGRYKDEDSYGYAKIIDKVTGQLLGGFENRDLGSNPEEAYKAYMGQFGTLLVSELKKADLPSWMRTTLDSLGEEPNVEALQAAFQTIELIGRSFEELGKKITGFADMTDLAFESLIKASGGIEALNANAGSFYQNFYSDDERKAATKKELDKQLKDLGVNIDLDADDAQAQFRKLVEDKLKAASGEEANSKALADVFAKGGGAEGLKDLAATGAFKDWVASTVGAGTADAGKLASDLENLAKTSTSLADFTAGVDKLTGSLGGTGKSSAETAAELLKLNTTFKAVTKTTEETAAAAEKEAAAKAKAAEEAKKREEDARKAAIDAAYANLQAAVEREREGLQQRLEDMRRIEDSLSSVVDTAGDAVRELRGNVQATAAMQASQAMATIDSALAALRAGARLPMDSAALTEAMSTAQSSITEASFASVQDYERAQLALAIKLSEISETGAKQLTDAQRTAEGIERQIAQNDKALDLYRKQIDGTNKVIDATLSVDEAIRRIEALLTPEKTPGGGGGGGTKTPTPDWGGGGGGFAPANNGKYKTPTAVLSGGLVVYDYASNDYTARLDALAPTFNKWSGTGDFAGLVADFQKAGGTAQDLAYLYGYSINDVYGAIDRAGIPRFEGGGDHFGGIRLVGERGPELELTGAARYLTAGQTRSVLAGGSAGSDSRIAELLGDILAAHRRLWELLARVANDGQRSREVLEGAARGNFGLKVAM
ncbi:phage tail tape measure protein [Delftia acidovorans]|uniref:phage tail tape measure protein n=1 Tax=Delftia acidovorans TaxID=80866 RepID=UPI0022AB8716|nr:phage tail tape measure protein [Delftia acidovorans]WAT84895.1 phage tail tape measure protein [Delftia acidovorans]